VTAEGCLGAFPRLTDWNQDGKKDLVVGLANGTLQVFLNANTNTEPKFGGGSTVQYGPPDAKTNITVGARTTVDVVDWNNDGRKDLVAGNTNGQLLLYRNAGTDAEPRFDGCQEVQADGVPINLGTQRSRPFAVDFNGDGRTDLLVGGTDGLIRLYVRKGMAPAGWTGASAFATSGSQAPIFTPGLAVDQPGDSAATDLVNLDALQADARFADADGHGWSVVVIDTGIDLDHPFFGTDANNDGVADNRRRQRPDPSPHATVCP